MRLKNVFGWWARQSLVLRIFIGLVVGAVLGLFVPEAAFISVLGKLFVGALKAIAPILVFVLIAASVSNVKGRRLSGSFRTLVARYMLTMVVAALVAVFASMIFPLKLKLTDVAGGDVMNSNIGGLFQNILVSIVQNPFKALAEANYLSILFWASMFGFGLKKISSASILTAMDDLANVVSKCVKWIIECAPFGIMGLVFSTVNENGMSVFGDYGKLLLLLIGCMFFSAFVTNPIIVAVIIKGNPYPLLFKCLKESGIPAFFTRSSAANIPVNIGLCEKMGVDKDFYSVAVPLGSVVNMDGAAVTITIMTMAACHTLGIEVSIVQAIVLSLLAAAAACGVSGVAGGSLLLIPMACSLFGISNDIAMQVVAVGFVIGVIQDSVETALNSSSDALFIIATDMNEKRKINSEK
ncbi:MAG: serine/threonine transporter SstT [Bacteroidales bacterium]|nr:serine/threonine transporter SstT [Bacteroidales bacterium]